MWYIGCDESEFRWYQFSLRTLLGLTTLVAILCSISIYTDWVFAVLIGSVVLVGGTAGWIVGRSRLGFAVGVIYATCLLLVFPVLLALVDMSGSAFRRFPGEWYFAACEMGTLVGGVVGGLRARASSKRKARQ
jgi:hypothetical protein